MPAISRGRPRKNVRIKGNDYPLDYRRAKVVFLQRYIAEALEMFEGNVSATARALGVSRRSVQMLSTRKLLDGVVQHISQSAFKEID